MKENYWTTAVRFYPEKFSRPAIYADKGRTFLFRPLSTVALCQPGNPGYSVGPAPAFVSSSCQRW
jgi:hypothetical protein